MPTKHAGTLAALLLTAALFAALPGLWRNVEPQRVADSLKPPELRTLTVWLCPDGPEDRKLLNALCSAFEKANRGARVFLRRVTVEELTGETAVLPDVLLFATGEINRPEEALLPLALEQAHASGSFASVCRAVPLWYAPAYLSYPESWGEDPSNMLRQPGAVTLPEGVALQQMLMTFPGFADPLSPTPAPSLPRDGVAPSRGQTPTPVPSISQKAKVVYGKPEGASVALLPDTSSCVRYAALCRDGADAQAFLAFLMDAQPDGFAKVQPETVLPNAFAHTREELFSLCLDGFTRGEDPAYTLLRLR